MIGKILKSGSFKALIEYLDKENAVVLGTNMYGQDSRELTAEYMTIRDLNPGIKQPVLHASLSLVPGETLTNDQFREVCEIWMEKMGFNLASNQYMIVRHQDTEHEHAHLAINRIDMISGKVVIDSYDRYRSQEIIRQLERTYALEPVAPSWQTFKNVEPDPEQTGTLPRRKELAKAIERAAQGNLTMPEFFQRLAEHQIQAEVQFTRTGKPKGITYTTSLQEKLAGNALGKAYSFPGLQKYLKVNYDPARDNHELTQIIQNRRQQQQELQTPQPQLETAAESSPPKQKPPQVWEPQYGIPAIQDLIQAIPESFSQPQTRTPDLAHWQREKVQAVYQQLATQVQAIYQVRESKQIDQRIAFLMQEQQQTPSQVTQVLAQSPNMQELVKRDRAYVESYSKFCQVQAVENQTTWLAELEQHRRAVEVERQRQEKRRIALERQQRQQQERQHNLKLLGQWQAAAIALNKPASYIERIQEIRADYQRGLPLSEQTFAARQQDLAAYQRQLQRQQQRGFSL